MVTTYIDRSNTNEEVFRQANSQIALPDQAIRCIQALLQQRRIALVGIAQLEWLASIGTTQKSGSTQQK